MPNHWPLKLASATPEAGTPRKTKLPCGVLADKVSRLPGTTLPIKLMELVMLEQFVISKKFVFTNVRFVWNTFVVPSSELVALQVRLVCRVPFVKQRWKF